MSLGVAFYVLQKYEMVGSLLRRNPGFKNGLFVATRNLNSTDLGRFRDWVSLENPTVVSIRC